MALVLLAALVAVATTPSSVGAFTAPGALLSVNRAKTGAFSPAENARVGQKQLVSTAPDPGGCMASYAQAGVGLWGAERVASRAHGLRLFCALSAGHRGSGGSIEGRLGSEKDVGLQGGDIKQSKAATRRPGGGGQQWSLAAEPSAKQATARPGESKSGHATNTSRHESCRFPMLSGFTTLESLLNATMPLLHDKLDRVRDESQDPRGGVRPADAVNMMNRLKQMSRDLRTGQKVDSRLVEAMEICAELSVGAMRDMHPKHVALALNAIKDRSWPLFSPSNPSGPGGIYDQLYIEAIERAILLLTPGGSWRSRPSKRESVPGRRGSSADDHGMPAQTLAMILNAATLPRDGDDDKERISKLFSFASDHMKILGHASGDAHSLATIANSFAGQGVWDTFLFRCVGDGVCSMPRQGFSLQSVGMILNSHSRFLERQSTWDVTEGDAEVFVVLSEVSVSLCHGLRLNKMSPGKAAGVVRSLTLILNAFAKVGMPDKHLFETVAGVLYTASDVRAKDGVSGSGLFDAQSVANLMNAYAKAGMLDKDIFDVLTVEAKALDTRSLEGQHIANILNSVVKGGHEDKELFDRMKEAIIKADRRQLSPQAIALVLNAYARAGQQDEALFSHMSAMIQQMSSGSSANLTPQSIANILNACAAGNFRDEALLKRLSSVCIEMRASDSLQLRHIGNIMNALVRLEHIDDAVFQHMTSLVKQLRGTPSDAQSLSLIANACAKAGLVDTELFQVISQEAQDLSQESFGPQSLAVLANAFSKLGIRDHGLFRRICDVTLMQAGDSFDEQSIANLVNAFSKSCISWPKHRHQAPSAWLQLEAMMRKLSRILLSMPPSSFTAQGVALIVNAYAKMSREGLVIESLQPQGEDVGLTLLFSHMGAVAIQMGSRCFELPCDAQHVSNIVNAYAKANIANVELFNHLSRVAQGMGRDAFDAQNVANIVHAYANLRIRDEELFAWMSRVAKSYEPGNFDSQHIANIVHSLAVLGIQDSDLISHLFNNVLRSRQTSLFQQDFNPQATANLAWSIAVLGVQDTQIHRWIAVSCAEKIGEMDKNALSQVHQFLLACELEKLHGDSDKLLSELQMHRDIIRDAFDGRAVDLRRAVSEGRMGASTLQTDVAYTLKAVGVSMVQEEYAEPSSGYSVDIRIPKTKIVIEVDGPTHYSLGGHDPLGHTQIKRRHLSALGYTLLTVPYWRWYHGLTREAKCRRLRGVISRQLKERGETFSTNGEVEALLDHFDEHRAEGELKRANIILDGRAVQGAKKEHYEKKAHALKGVLEVIRTRKASA